MNSRSWTYVAIAAAAALSACRGGFRLNQYPTHAALYAAGMREYQREHWGNAVTAFEKLTNDLPARDTLLPRAHWYLANAHARQKENLLAAQSFSRLFESFPEDSLADDAALEAARAYKRLWRRPSLDATYGETALAAYGSLLGLFPDTPHKAEAEREIAELEQWFASKNYETGRFYMRRRAYDSAIIYFRIVLERWPHVPRARDALLGLAQAFRAIRYREDFDETCTRLKAAYATDSEVQLLCRDARVVDTTQTRRTVPSR